MSRMKDIIAAKKKQQASKKAGSQRTFKPVAGKHVYRILPSWRGAEEDVWHDFAQHWIRSEKNGKPEAVFVCADKTFEKPCEVCMAISRGISGSSDDDTVETLTSAKASQKFLFNVLHLSDKAKKDEVQLMEVGSTVFDQVLDIMDTYLEEGIDITSTDKGIDLIITREGSGFDTSYRVQASPKGSRKIDASITERLINIDEFVAQESAATELKALTVVAKTAGIMPPESTAALPSKAAAALDDLDDAIDVTPEPVAAAEAEPVVEDALSGDDLDDLDDLLADLG